MGCPRIDTGNFLPLLKVAHKRLSVIEKSGQTETKGGVNFCVSSTNYKYQGQELQETGFYSFKWRQYMPDVGRFFNIDPLAEKFTYNSTYAFQENKMGLGRELEGLELLQERGLIKANGMTVNDIYTRGPLPSYMSYLNYKPNSSSSQGMDVADLPSGARGMGKWGNDGHFTSFAGDSKMTKALGVLELKKLIDTAIDAPGEIKAMGESAKAVNYMDKLTKQFDAMQTAQDVVNDAGLKLDNKTKTEVTNYVFDGSLPKDINSRSNSIVNLGSKSNIVNTANAIMRQNEITVRNSPEVQKKQELEQQRMEHQNKLERVGQ